MVKVLEPLIIGFLLFLRMCRGEDTNAIFRVEKENGAIENAQAFHEQKVATELQCFFKALQQPRTVCFIQTIFTEESMNWICQFFEGIKKSSFQIIQKTNSKVYAPQKLLDFCLFNPAPQDCLDWYNHGFVTDGVYTIEINNIVKKVYCDMTRDSGGWTIIQNRFDGGVSFDRTWKEYKDGFGDSYGEYWLGNEFTHHLTNGKDSKIRLVGGRFSGEQNKIIAKGFYLENEEDKYKLHSGTKVFGDDLPFSSWNIHDLQRFSTKDADNDALLAYDCSKLHGGGWWFEPCQKINFNGPYFNKEDLEVERIGVVWYGWLGNMKSLKSTEMAVKRGN